MNSAQLKIFACITMLIDHIGAVLYPDMGILRIIGRLAFPIFAYLIAEGYRHTKDVTDYMGRLMAFALISQLAFNAAFLGSATKPRELSLNVLFTLVMGLYSLYLYDKKKNFIVVVIIAALCQLLKTDYGAFGVLLVFVSNKYHDNFKKLSLSYILVMIFYILQWFLRIKTANPTLPISDIFFVYFTIEPIALLSLILIKLYNGERGMKLKYFFYSFYPVHLFILALISKMK